MNVSHDRSYISPVSPLQVKNGSHEAMPKRILILCGFNMSIQKNRGRNSTPSHRMALLWTLKAEML